MTTSPHPPSSEAPRINIPGRRTFTPFAPSCHLRRRVDAAFARPFELERQLAGMRPVGPHIRA